MRKTNCLLLVAATLFGCAQKDPGGSERDLAGHYVSIKNGSENLQDRYQEIDSSAFIGVDKNAAYAALAGNRYISRAIGDEFVLANHINEARYWFQISAENGDGVAMQNLSVMIRDFNCTRANYWLKKALSTNDLGVKSRMSIKEDLKKYEVKCVPTSITE